jgi:hypothetical protein
VVGTKEWQHCDLIQKNWGWFLIDLESEEAEAAIRKHEDHIEALIRKAAKKVTHIK